MNKSLDIRTAIILHLEKMFRSVPFRSVPFRIFSAPIKKFFLFLSTLTFFSAVLADSTRTHALEIFYIINLSLFIILLEKAACCAKMPGRFFLFIQQRAKIKQLSS